MSISRPQLFISWLQSSFVSSSYALLYAKFLFLVRRPIILPLCSSKIAWNSYVPLQIISEYFPARGRSVNRVKKPSSFVEFELARNERPCWIRMLLDPGNECSDPWCNAVKNAVNFNGQTITVDYSSVKTSKSPGEWCLKATTSGFFRSRNNCKYEESQTFWIRT